MDYAAERQGFARQRHCSMIVLLGSVVAFFLLVTCGCTSLPDWLHNGLKVGPNYVKPMAPIESHWIDYGHDSRISEAPVDTCAWWTVFNDPVLNGLIETAAQQNLTLRETGTRILQAQAAAGIAAGNLFPQVQQAFGSYDHVQLSKTIANSPPIKNYDVVSTGLNVSWEIDFWGRYRRALESADASLDASIEGYDNVLVILLSDVAATYVKIRTLQEELRLVRENVRLQKEAVTIAEAQFNAGQADAADTLQTRNNVEQTEALIPRFEAALRQANNALCVLLGLPPRDLVAELGEGPIPSAPPEVALGIPAQLLRRRPDIRQAERIVAAQSALIGVAEADLYPFFSIGGTLQWQSQNLSSLFNSNSFGGSTGPSFGWNVLNYGRILNSVRQQEAVFEQAVYAYQGTVLSAQQETEDAIVGFLKAQEQNAKLQLAVRDIQELNQVLLTQANAGATDFSRVFVVQAAATEQMDRLATSRGEIALNLIRIYQALGGGWQIRLQSPSNFPIPVAIEADEPIEVPPIPEPLPTPADLQ